MAAPVGCIKRISSVKLTIKFDLRLLTKCLTCEVPFRFKLAAAITDGVAFSERFCEMFGQAHLILIEVKLFNQI